MGIAAGMKDIVQDIVSSREVRVAEVKRLKKEANEMLGSFQASHKEMSAELRKTLAQGEAERKKISAELKKELTDYVRGIRSEVAGMRQETKADLGEARTAWQELTRGVKKATVKATPEAVKAEVAKAAPVEEETPDLEAKLLAAITEHPLGITLTEVAESLGIASIVLGRAARKLVGEGKIRKEDKAYFPARAE